jgi:4-amino-4-deoxy-L-arabinose transferase-like glycosyltransferase
LAGSGDLEMRKSGTQGIRESGTRVLQIPVFPFRDSLIPISSFLCILFLLLAWALRLYQLEADSLWGDEIFTATQSPLPALELLRWTAGDIHPPGYYLIVGRLADWSGWVHLSPSALTDWLWRFPSVVVGTLAVAVTFRLGTDLLSRQVGLVGALFLAVSPVAIQYSQEARMHGLFLLSAALSTWTLGRALARPGRWRWWLAYALATALSLYTVYLAFVVLAAQGAWVLKCQISNIKSPILGWLASVALAFVLYLPWWPTLLEIVNRRLTIDVAEPGVGSPLVFLVKGIHSMGPAPGWAAWLFLGLWAIGLASVIARGDLALALFAGLWLALPLALPFVFQDPRALHVRYVFLLPVYLVFVGLGALVLVAGGWKLLVGSRGISELGDREIKGSANWVKRLSAYLVPGSQIARLPDSPILLFFYSAALLGLVLVSALFLPGYYQRTKPDWRGVGAYLTAQTIPGDVIVTGPLFDVGRYLDYYYDGPAELLPPAALVANLPDRVDSMRASGGRVWAVTRFQPAPVGAVQSLQFAGLTVSEPVVPIYEADPLEAAMVDLMQQAVVAAPQWAVEMSAEGVMTPDPMVARAAAYLFLGDVHRAAGHLSEAVAAYESMVADHPASAGAYATLAEAYEAAGQPEAAVRAYRRAVALNPTWQGSDAEDAASLADAGRWTEAVAAYRAVVW